MLADGATAVDAGDATATDVWAPGDAGAEAQKPYAGSLAEALKRRRAPSDAGAPSASAATASSRTERRGGAREEEEEDQGGLSLFSFLPVAANA